jgi:hypothetical protein
VITKKETPLSVSAALATMTAPTAPALPSIQAAIDLRLKSGNAVPVERAHITAGEWRQLSETILTMQRERDEAQSVAKGVADVQADVPRENVKLREQLAASERTCAELKHRLSEVE